MVTEELGKEKGNVYKNSLKIAVLWKTVATDFPYEVDHHKMKNHSILTTIHIKLLIPKRARDPQFIRDPA